MKYNWIKLLCKGAFLLLIIIEATGATELRHTIKKEICLKPFKGLELKLYLVEEDGLELWLFIGYIQAPTEIFCKNRQFPFEGNVLQETRYIQVTDVLDIELLLSIKKMYLVSTFVSTV